MSIFSFIGGIISPVTDLIQTFKLPPEKEAQLKIELQKVENTVSLKVLDYEKKLMDAQASVLKAEATSSSWLTKSWRPLSMCVFLVLIVADSINLLPKPLPDTAWLLMQLGLAGYVGGRSLEKIAPQIVKVVNGKK
jgi:hypothetical protein